MNQGNGFGFLHGVPVSQTTKFHEPLTAKQTDSVHEVYDSIEPPTPPQVCERHQTYRTYPDAFFLPAFQVG